MRVLILLLAAAAGRHHCIHDALQATVAVGAGGGPTRAHSGRRLADDEPLNLGVQLSGRWGASTPAVPTDLDAAVSNFAFKVVDLVEKRVEALFDVVDKRAELSWTAEACYIGTGTFHYDADADLPLADTDFALFLSISDESCASNALAWAAACLIDPDTQQPTAGVANLCRSRLEAVVVDDHDSLEYWVDVLTHEVLHALGFSAALLADEDNLAVTEERGHTVTRLVTPSAAAAARAQYNCSSLAGLELEDQGSASTAGSHIEGRIAFNELMTGVLNYPAALSAMSLAVLEDTGYYAANYEFAEPLPFGQDAGCAFATAACVSGGGVALAAEFCVADEADVCTHDRSGIGACDLVSYGSSIASYYRYFGSSSRGGAVYTMDYCPVVERYGDGGCDRPENHVGTDRGELYGLDSLCFEVDGQAGCFLHSCSGDGVLSVSLVDENDHVARTVECPVEGGLVDTVLCPPASEVCSSACNATCLGNGHCDEAAGACVCTNFDFTGADCSVEVCPGACAGNGVCDVDSGECECFEGFYDDDCGAERCSSRAAGCNGNGECGDDGVCACDVNFAGPNCDALDCAGEPDCGGAGYCTGDAGCVCDALFAGDACASEEAGGEAPDCLNDCSGDVCECSAAAACRCQCAAGRYGGDCSLGSPETFGSVYVTADGWHSLALLREAMAAVFEINAARVVVTSAVAGDSQVQTALYAASAAHLDDIVSAANNPDVRVELAVALAGLGANYTVEALAGTFVTEPSTSVEESSGLDEVWVVVLCVSAAAMVAAAAGGWARRRRALQVREKDVQMTDQT